MAKTCVVDNQKIGLMAGYIRIADGDICRPHWKAAGFNVTTDPTKLAAQVLAKEVKHAVENGENLKAQLKAKEVVLIQGQNAETESVKQMLIDKGLAKFNLKDKEFLQLSQTIASDETVLAVTSGRLNMTNKSILVGTDRRIIELRNLVITSYPLRNITELTYLKLGNLYIVTSGKKVFYSETDKSTAADFVNIMSSKLY